MRALALTVIGALGCGGEPRSLPTAPVAATVSRPKQTSTDGGAPALAPGGDADGDLMANSCDLCPYEPERYDGRNDDDGCPDRSNHSFDPPPEQETVAEFAKDSARPVRPLRDVADNLAADYIRAWQGIELVACIASSEPPELLADRIDALADALIAAGVDPAAITHSDKPCFGSSGVSFTHGRWATGYPVVRVPTEVGCPAPRQTTLYPSNP